MRQALPSGWEWVPLSRLVSKIEAGKSFKCDERPPSGDEPGIVKVSAVTWGRYDEGESKTITDLDRVNPAYLIRPGDLLFSRANTLQLVGACVLVHATTKRLLLSDKTLRLVMPEALKPWVLWFLRSAEGRRQIEALSTGNQESMRNIGQERIGQIEVPLPPGESLQRIVSRIEELFSEIDEGERALERVGQLVERYRQSVLKAAVTGELTGEAGTSSDGWRYAPLGDLSTLVTSGSRGWSDFYADDGPIFIRAQNIKHDVLDLTDIAHVNLEGVREGLRTRVAKEDLLVTITGANVTKTAYVDADLSEAYVSQHVALIRVQDAALARYLYYWLISPANGRAQLLEAAYGAGKPGLSLKDLRDLVVPVPPPEQCVRIADMLAVEMSRLESIVAQRRAGVAAASTLRQSILKAAFSGRLIPQDPRDEPASALLARLAAQAAEAPAAPKRRGRKPAQPAPA